MGSAVDWEYLTALAEQAVTGDRARWDALWIALSPTVTTWIGRLSYFRATGQHEDHCRDVLLETWEKLQRRDFHVLRRFFDSEKTKALLETGGPRARADYFRAWLHLVVRQVGQDHLRKIPEYVQRRKRLAPEGETGATASLRKPSAHRWRAVESLTTGKAMITAGATRKLFAEQVLAFLDASVDKRERRAVELARQEMSWASLARELDLADAKRAESFVRRARDRIHYRRALELWCNCYTSDEIAAILDLSGPDHAARIVKAAKALLRRHFLAASRPGGTAGGGR